MIRRQKVFAYITLEKRLLVFMERGLEHFGRQVPAGSPKDGESLERAVLRESHEETGLDGLRVVTFIGSVSMDQKKYGLNEIHDRHFFHLVYDGPAKEQWRHVESDPSIVTEHTPETIVFDFRWIDLESERPILAEGHDAFLDELFAALH